MSPDAELLRRYVADHAEDAFTELVRRHLGLVYSLALPRVGYDAHLAEDIAQKVFCDLARKASSLTGRASLSGWLCVSAHVAAAEVVEELVAAGRGGEQAGEQQGGRSHGHLISQTSA